MSMKLGSLEALEDQIGSASAESQPAGGRAGTEGHGVAWAVAGLPLTLLSGSGTGLRDGLNLDRRG